MECRRALVEANSSFLWGFTNLVEYVVVPFTSRLEGDSGLFKKVLDSHSPKNTTRRTDCNLYKLAEARGIVVAQRLQEDRASRTHARMRDSSASVECQQSSNSYFGVAEGLKNGVSL